MGKKKSINHIQFLLLIIGLLFWCSGCAGFGEEMSIFGTRGDYQEPPSGPYLIVSNKMTYKTLFGRGKIRIDYIRIDGKYIGGTGKEARINYGEEKKVHISPGKHRIAIYPRDYDYYATHVEVSNNDILFKCTCPLPGTYKVTMYTLEREQEKESAISQDDPFKKLEKLKELYDKEIISENEYESKKQEILEKIK